jgi:hypothetical protein
MGRNKTDEYSHSWIERTIKRLEKYEHDYVFTLWPTKEFACGEYFKWMGVMSPVVTCLMMGLVPECLRAAKGCESDAERT